MSSNPASCRTRTRICIIAGCLLLFWAYLSINQFQHALHIVTDPPMIIAEYISDSDSNILSNSDQSELRNSLHFNPPNINPQHVDPVEEEQPPTTSTSTTTMTPTIWRNTTFPTPDPSIIIIDDEHLTESDEIELSFEFKNDGHLYLYDVPYFTKQNVFIMSMVTNSSELALEQQLATLDEISCLFENTHFLIFESNSVDETPTILRQWTMNQNNDTLSHRTFCSEYLFGFHRDRIHFFNETGDALHSVYPDGFTKQKAVERLRSEQMENTKVLTKTVLFGDGHVVDAMNRFKIDKNTRFLDRIEKYAVFRNMMLSVMKDIVTDHSSKSNVIFDYLLVLDLDIFGFQQRVFLSELHYYHRHRNRQGDTTGNVMLCAHGTLAHGFYVDTFASVDAQNQWYFEYQRNASFENVSDDILGHFPVHRFEPMRSCFGGIVAYSNVIALIESQCDYTVIWSRYDVDKGTVSQSVVDAQYPIMTRFADQMRDWRPPKRPKERRYKKRDNHICEHIPFHFCLFERADYSGAIAKYAYLFYEEKSRYRLDFNERLIEQTPSPTSESIKERRRRKRREEREAKRKRNEMQMQNDQVQRIGRRLQWIDDMGSAVINERQRSSPLRIFLIALIVSVSTMTILLVPHCHSRIPCK